MLNRCAIIVRPLEPFAVWAQALPGADPEIVPDPNGEQNVYLLPDLADGGDIEEMIAEAFDIIFENELATWNIDEAAWPKNRTLDMFKKWFSIEVHSVIHDLGAEELFDDENE